MTEKALHKFIFIKSAKARQRITENQNQYAKGITIELVTTGRYIKKGASQKPGALNKGGDHAIYFKVLTKLLKTLAVPAAFR